MADYWRTETDIIKLRSKCDIGTGCSISRACAIDGNRPAGRVSIGNNTTITEGVMILCHDAAGTRTNCRIQYGHTIIGDKCFIGIRSVILPGVTIGDNCIVGACSVVTKDIPHDEVWAGNPAKFICTAADYKIKHKK